MTDEDSNDEDITADADRRADAARQGGERGRVLTPEDLDISNSEYVSELDEEGRYVVSAGGRPSTEGEDPAGRRGEPIPPDDAAGDPRRRATDATRRPSRRDDQAVSPEAARSLLSEELDRTDVRYGIDIVARFDGRPVRHRTVSNDVVATFEDLVRWYAQHVADETPTDEVIEILFREASLTPSGTTPNLASLLDGHDLEPDDSIAALVEAIRDEAVGE